MISRYSCSFCRRSSDTETARITLGIKNLMSHRSVTRLKFNKIFEEYRKRILVNTTAQDLSAEDSQALFHLNCFFCGLHFVSSSFDVIKKGMKTYAKIRNPNREDEESLGYRLTHAASRYSKLHFFGETFTMLHVYVAKIARRQFCETTKNL